MLYTGIEYQCYLPVLKFMTALLSVQNDFNHGFVIYWILLMEVNYFCCSLHFGGKEGRKEGRMEMYY